VSPEDRSPGETLSFCLTSGPPLEPLLKGEKSLRLTLQGSGEASWVCRVSEVVTVGTGIIGVADSGRRRLSMIGRGLIRLG